MSNKFQFLVPSLSELQLLTCSDKVGRRLLNSFQFLLCIFVRLDYEQHDQYSAREIRIGRLQTFTINFLKLKQLEQSAVRCFLQTTSLSYVPERYISFSLHSLEISREYKEKKSEKRNSPWREQSQHSFPLVH